MRVFDRCLQSTKNSNRVNHLPYVAHRSASRLVVLQDVDEQPLFETLRGNRTDEKGTNRRIESVVRDVHDHRDWS